MLERALSFLSFFCGRVQIANFRIAAEGEIAHNLSGFKDRKRSKADLESRESPRRRCKREIFSRVSQVDDRGVQRRPYRVGVSAALELLWAHNKKHLF